MDFMQQDEYAGVHAHAIGNYGESPLQQLAPLPPNDFEETPVAPLPSGLVFSSTNTPTNVYRGPNVITEPPISERRSLQFLPLSTSSYSSVSLRPSNTQRDVDLLRAMTENLVAMNRRMEADHRRTNDIESMANSLLLGVHGNSAALQKLSKQVSSLTQKFQDCKENGIKITTTTRPKSASDLLAQLIYNGTQTASGFLCILCYASSALNEEMVVVSLVSAVLLCSRVGLPSTQRAVSSSLLTLGFTAGANFTESEHDDLMGIFCLRDVKTAKTRRKRFYSMPANRFFGLLVNLEVPPAVRIRDNFGAKFRAHDLADQEQAYLPSIGTALWTELYQIWGDFLDKYITRARTQLNLDPLQSNKRSNIHGIEPSAGRVLSFEQAAQAKRASARARRR